MNRRLLSLLLMLLLLAQPVVATEDFTTPAPTDEPVVAVVPEESATPVPSAEPSTELPGEPSAEPSITPSIDPSDEPPTSPPTDTTPPSIEPAPTPSPETIDTPQLVSPPTVAATPADAPTLTLDQEQATLHYRDKLQLTATWSDSDDEPELVWQSDNTKVATVADGLVTASGIGTANITVSCGEQSAVCVVTVAPKAVPPFEDVFTHSWFVNYVLYVHENGLMGGTAPTLFSPGDGFSRAMAATVLYRMAGKPAVSYTKIADDVPKGQWYTNACIWARKNNIIYGSSNKLFGINETFTREQMVSVFYRYAAMQGYRIDGVSSLTQFGDSAKVSGYAVAPFQWAVKQALIVGNDVGHLNPRSTMTRAECAALLMRFNKFLTPANKDTFSLTPMTIALTGTDKLTPSTPSGTMTASISGLRIAGPVTVVWLQGNKVLRKTENVLLLNGYTTTISFSTTFHQYTPASEPITLQIYTPSQLRSAVKTVSYQNNPESYYINNKILPYNIILPNVTRTVFGTSGSGRELCAYSVGTGAKKMVLTFAIHAFEDHWTKDGYELVLVAEMLLKRLSADVATLNSRGWTVIVVPYGNPDGFLEGYTNNGPGRTTTKRYSGGTLVTGGVDLNRCFETGFKPLYNARNYTGDEPLLCKEARALKSLLVTHSSASTKVCIDVHGWFQQIITPGNSTTPYKSFRKFFPNNSYAGLGGLGYLTGYAKAIGYNACLFEFPSNVYSHSDMTSNSYDSRFASAVMDIIATL